MNFINAFLGIFLDMSLYMVIGMILTGILHVVMKKDTVAKHLGKDSKLPAVKAAAMGVPLPLCSCGVLPTTVYLSQNGATTSAVMAFLISTPQTGVDSIIATLGMMGVVMAIYRPIAAFISGVAGGAIIQRIAGDKKIEEQGETACCAGDSCATDRPEKIAVKTSVWDKVKGMVRYAFVAFIDDIALHFIVGVLIATAITLIIPTGFFERISISSGVLAMIVMLVVGLPMYICSTSSIPIALALMAKGISPGAAFVFLFAGPATNAASLAVLSKSLGKKTVAIYLAVTAVSAIGFGLLLDGIIGWFSLPMPNFMAHTAAHGSSWIKIVAGIIFAATLLRSIANRLIRRIKKRKSANSKAAHVLEIDGMTCAHCAKSVTDVLVNCDGVHKVSVDVKQGKAYVDGENMDIDDLRKAVTQAGYSAK